MLLTTQRIKVEEKILFSMGLMKVTMKPGKNVKSL